MGKRIYSDLREAVSKKGILAEGRGICDAFVKNLYRSVQGLGEDAIAHMAGEIEEGYWMGIARDVLNITKDDVGPNYLLKILLNEVEGVFTEKGFRYGPGLLTAREHRECGSSGYAKFSGPDGEYDDMPVPLANKILKIREEDEDISIEGVRKARELLGKSTINDEGYVTGEVIKRDSYHFLSPEAKEAIIEREIKISAALDMVSQGILDTNNTYINQFLSALKIYLMNVGEGEKRLSTEDLIKSVPKIKDSITGKDIEFSRIISGAKAVAFGLGYRDGILTPQEVAISGRTKPEHDQMDPFIPIGVQQSEIDTDQASKKRSEERCFTVDTDLFTGYDYPITLSLEPLDNEGKTIQGPFVIDPFSGLPSEKMTEFYREKCGDIPFPRPGDWFLKG